LWITEINWSLDGNKIAYIWEESYLDGNYEDRIAYINVNNKEETIVESGQRGQLGSFISWSPDSRLLTYVRNPISDQAQLIVSEPSKGCVVRTYPIRNHDGTAVWSPNGEVILVRYFGDLFFLNVEKVFGRPYDQLSCTK
jgi:Tol biopolymer transport system component